MGQCAVHGTVLFTADQVNCIYLWLALFPFDRVPAPVVSRIAAETNHFTLFEGKYTTWREGSGLFWALETIFPAEN